VWKSVEEEKEKVLLFIIPYFPYYLVWGKRKKRNFFQLGVLGSTEIRNANY